MRDIYNDYELEGEEDEVRRLTYHADEKSRRNPFLNCVFSVLAFVQYHFVYNRLEFVAFLVVTFLCILGVVGFAVGVDEHFHNLKHGSGVSNGSNSFMVKLDKIDHWCIAKSDDTCPLCSDPTKPFRGTAKRWSKSHTKNIDTVSDYLYKKDEADRLESQHQHDLLDDVTITTGDNSAYYGNEEYYLNLGADNYFGDNEYNIDVVFLGDSITEARAGQVGGVENTDLKEIENLFQKKVDEESTTTLVFGFAGDTAPNLLWRVSEGQEFEGLYPKVWWITIGTNELIKNKCSEDVTLMGILALVEVLQKRSSGYYNPVIVINSILPFSSSQKHGQLTGSKTGFDYWSSIKSVNKSLKQFAKKTKNVKYFDASSIFVNKEGKEEFIKDRLMMNDGMHPNEKGHKKWLEEQMNELIRINDEFDFDNNDAYYGDDYYSDSGDDTFF